MLASLLSATLHGLDGRPSASRWTSRRACPASPSSDWRTRPCRRPASGSAERSATAATSTRRGASRSIWRRPTCARAERRWTWRSRWAFSSGRSRSGRAGRWAVLGELSLGGESASRGRAAADGRRPCQAAGPAHRGAGGRGRRRRHWPAVWTSSRPRRWPRRPLSCGSRGRGAASRPHRASNWPKK